MRFAAIQMPTAIPAFCVDAVCHVPYGSYPGNMAGEYFSDETHLRAWLDAERDVETYRAFLDKYLYGVDCFESYLEICARRRAAGRVAAVGR